MFLVWGPQGEPTSYIPGEIFAKRRVEKIDHIRHTDHVTPQTPRDLIGQTSPDAKSHLASAYEQTLKEIPKREPAILAKQILKSPAVSLLTNSSLAEAWELFKSRRFRHIPVLSLTGKLIGILSDRDLLQNLDRIHQNENAEGFSSNFQVGDVMTTPVLTAHPDTEIREIARVLFDERIGAMPIMDDEGALVGIVTRSDILRTVRNQVPFELWV